MKSKFVHSKLLALSRVQGVLACALAECDSGLIWETTDTLELPEAMVEAATSFWRLYERNRVVFEEMGELYCVTLLQHRRIL